MNAPVEAPFQNTASTEAVERAHALLSASGAYRWLECTPSARWEEQFPDAESEYAKEGTWAHDLSELKLLGLLGRIDEAEYLKRLEGSRASKYWSQANEEAVDAYVEFAWGRIQHARSINPDATVLLEERLDYSRYAPEGFGTGDLVLIYDRVVEVTDLKFGKGKVVSATDNPQAKYYGLGAVEGYGFLYELDKVVLNIFQPRRNTGEIVTEPNTWELDVAELLAWGEKTKPIALTAWKGEGEFKAGDHCDFCRGRARCRARAEANLAEVANEFADPNTLTDEELAGILVVAKERAAWYSDIQEHAQAEAIKGHKLPGWKLVEGRSNRRYKNRDDVALRLVTEGIPEAVIYEPRTLLGITAMEKALGKKKFSELLSDLVEKPAGKPTLVPASDPRHEIEPGSAIDGFEDL